MLPFAGILTLLTGPLIWILVSLSLLTGILIALTLLAGVLSAALLSGVLATLILLIGVLIGFVWIIRIVHSNVFLQSVPTSPSVPRFLWKVVCKESARKQVYQRSARIFNSGVKNGAR
jgi:hypothetical protein